MDLLCLLDSMRISYEKLEHKAVFTCQDAEFISSKIDGVLVKNLFLKDENNRYYVYLLSSKKRADFKSLERKIGVKKLSFGSETMLSLLLGLIKGSVTPLGIINDKDNMVTILIDEDLINEKVFCHPNVNTITISLLCEDLIKFIEFFSHKYLIV